jgi:hypothetical protein
MKIDNENRSFINHSSSELAERGKLVELLQLDLFIYYCYICFPRGLLFVLPDLQCILLNINEIWSIIKLTFCASEI